MSEGRKGGEGRGREGRGGEGERFSTTHCQDTITVLDLIVQTGYLPALSNVWPMVKDKNMLRSCDMHARSCDMHVSCDIRYSPQWSGPPLS